MQGILYIGNICKYPIWEPRSNRFPKTDIRRSDSHRVSRKVTLQLGNRSTWRYVTPKKTTGLHKTPQKLEFYIDNRTPKNARRTPEVRMNSRTPEQFQNSRWTPELQNDSRNPDELQKPDELQALFMSLCLDNRTPEIPTEGRNSLGQPDSMCIRYPISDTRKIYIYPVPKKMFTRSNPVPLRCKKDNDNNTSWCAMQRFPDKFYFNAINFPWNWENHVVYEN